MNKSHFRKIRKNPKKRKSFSSRKRRRKSSDTRKVPSSSLPTSSLTYQSNTTTTSTTQSESETPASPPGIKRIVHVAVPSNPDNTVKGMKSWIDQRRLKESISFIYEFTYHPLYVEGTLDLYGRSGIISAIANSLYLKNTHYKTIKKVILDTIECINNDEVYEGHRSTYACPSRRKVDPSSFDMHHIAKLKENGSFRITAGMYNALIRAPLGLSPIGYTSIYNTIKRSNHKVVRTEKIHQASDRNSTWVKARFQANSQLMVRFGMEYPANTSGMKVQDPKFICKETINKEKLTLTIHQIGWWDEKHIKQIVGDFRDHSYQFGFDEDGKYDRSIEIELVRRVSKDVKSLVVHIHFIFILTYLYHRLQSFKVQERSQVFRGRAV